MQQLGIWGDADAIGDELGGRLTAADPSRCDRTAVVRSATQFLHPLPRCSSPSLSRLGRFARRGAYCRFRRCVQRLLKLGAVCECLNVSEITIRCYDRRLACPATAPALIRTRCEHERQDRQLNLSHGLTIRPAVYRIASRLCTLQHDRSARGVSGWRRRPGRPHQTTSVAAFRTGRRTSPDVRWSQSREYCGLSSAGTSIARHRAPLTRRPLSRSRHLTPRRRTRTTRQAVSESGEARSAPAENAAG